MAMIMGGEKNRRMRIILVLLILSINFFYGFCFTGSPTAKSSWERFSANAFDYSTKQSQLVPRVTLEEYLSSSAEDKATKPILIRDLVKPEALESLTGNLLDTLGDEVVQMQRKIRCSANPSDHTPSTQTEIYDIALKETIDYMMINSCHEDSFFTFCEGMLPSTTLSEKGGSNALFEISQKLTKVREIPFNGGENWFDYFPSSIKPADALVLAGRGSTSTLHRDPFEWRGTSFCLEGTKIWRFIPPLINDEEEDVARVDELLGAYRLDSIAWSDDKETEKDANSLVVSAGWQSDLCLFESISEDAPSTKELLKLEECNIDKYISMIETLGRDPSRLSPDEMALSALQTLESATSNELAFQTAIHRAGDLLLIPPHCWHQTYAVVPSVAVASQRCGAEVDGSNVIKHVLGLVTSNDKAWKAKLPEILQRVQYEEGMGKDVVRALVRHLESVQR
mmetsp:Transcript_2154/g.3099  ORF Transcript_2154/g.3099 Transcript_2154/m.3099 type:complete len:453 (+) Transcript_2154:74-1432(+)